MQSWLNQQPAAVATRMDRRRSVRAPRSGLRHLAGRVVGPVAIEPDHAPFDAPLGADHAGVLGNRIMDGVLAAVRDLDHAAAETARDGVGGPGAERGLANLLETDDLEVDVP